MHTRVNKFIYTVYIYTHKICGEMGSTDLHRLHTDTDYIHVNQTCLTQVASLNCSAGDTRLFSKKRSLNLIVSYLTSCWTKRICSRAKPRLYLIFPIALNVKCAFRLNCRQTNNIAISQYCSQSNDLNSPRIWLEFTAKWICFGIESVGEPITLLQSQYFSQSNGKKSEFPAELYPVRWNSFNRLQESGSRKIRRGVGWNRFWRGRGNVEAKSGAGEVWRFIYFSYYFFILGGLPCFRTLNPPLRSVQKLVC